MPCQIFRGCSVKKYREKGENGGQIMKKTQEMLGYSGTFSGNKPGFLWHFTIDY